MQILVILADSLYTAKIRTAKISSGMLAGIFAKICTNKISHYLVHVYRTCALKHLAGTSVLPAGLIIDVVPCSKGTKIKGTKISSQGLEGN